MTELRRLWNVLRSHAKAYAGSPRFATVHNNDGFEKQITHTAKNYTDVKKCATINSCCDVKKQHDQSEMKFIPLYHLSQSGMRFIKLLNKSRHV
jgi:hypothetical protein